MGSIIAIRHSSVKFSIFIIDRKNGKNFRYFSILTALNMMNGENNILNLKRFYIRWNNQTGNNAYLSFAITRNVAQVAMATVRHYRQNVES
jgi:hypothetical protein